MPLGALVYILGLATRGSLATCSTHKEDLALAFPAFREHHYRSNLSFRS